LRQTVLRQFRIRPVFRRLLFIVHATFDVKFAEIFSYCR
jgi:hypothetical protein